MARYTLIMNDEIFYELMGICKDEKVSMGKKLNQIVNNYVIEKSKTPDKFKKQICQHPIKKGYKCSVEICPQIITEKEYPMRKVVCNYLK